MRSILASPASGKMIRAGCEIRMPAISGSLDGDRPALLILELVARGMKGFPQRRHGLERRGPPGAAGVANRLVDRDRSKADAFLVRRRDGHPQSAQVIQRFIPGGI